MMFGGATPQMRNALSIIGKEHGFMSRAEQFALHLLWAWDVELVHSNGV